MLRKRPFETSDKRYTPGSNSEAEKPNHMVRGLLGNRNRYDKGAFTSASGSGIPCSSVKLHELS